MGIISHVQTFWAQNVVGISQVARMVVAETAAGPELVIQDVASASLSRIALGPGVIAPAQIRVTPSGPLYGTGSTPLDIGEQTRRLDMAVLTDLTRAGGADTATAYLDRAGFFGNLVSLHSLTFGAQSLLYAALQNGAGITALQVAANGTLTRASERADGPDSYLAGISAMTSVQTPGGLYLLAASMTESGLSVMRVGAGGHLTPVAMFGTEQLLPVDRPATLAAVTVQGQSFVLLGSFGTSSLTVLRLGPDGTLHYVDQVLDSLETRFGGLTAMDVITVGNQVLVAVAGSDGGVSVFQMLPQGRLVLRDTFVDVAATALQHVQQLRFVTVGDRIELYVLSTGDRGVTRLLLDPGQAGISTMGITGTPGNDVLTAAAGGQRLQAAGGDDILVDGSGADTLAGGAGRDLFVFLPDRQTDTITDFDITQDRLDLSGFAMASSPADLQIILTATGAHLRLLTEVIRLISVTGAPLDPARLATAVLFNADHLLTPQVPPTSVPVAPTERNDLFYWISGAQVTDGGAGSDVITYAAAPVAAVVDLADSTRNGGAAAGDVLRSIEGVDGSRFGDVIQGDGLANTLRGLAGADRLAGLGGNDWLVPGAGSDTVEGGAGIDMVSFLDDPRGVTVNLATGRAQSGSDTDLLTGFENVTGSIYADVITGSAGANWLRGMGDYDWFLGSGGRDTLDGGNGRDMVSYAASQVRVVVDLGAGRGLEGLAAGDVYVSVERVTGSIHHDVFYGSPGEDDVRGLGGNDWSIGSPGRDRHDGGTGRDTVAYITSAAGVSASLLLGRGSGGDAGRDLYTAIENLTGSSHADTLTGGHDTNELRGMTGDDFIFGNGGSDRLSGGRGRDSIDGGAGYDTAVFDGVLANYIITTRGAVTTVTDRTGTEGTDTLTNTEVLLFDDRSLLL